MTDRIYFLILGTMAVWRVSHLLTDEDGPWDLLRRFRKSRGSGFWGSLFNCFYCLSLWVAVPVVGYLRFTGRTSWGEALLLWPALSGAAILLERATKPPQAIFVEDPEEPEGKGPSQ